MITSNIFSYLERRINIILIIALIACQVYFSTQSRHIKPDYNLIPNPVNKSLQQLFSLGDSELLFRFLIIRIQNAGDVYAGRVPLKYYDYEKLYNWFILLDDINDKSNIVPSLASYVYANVNDEKKLRYLINYLEYRGVNNIDQNWWWVFQATYLARKINDTEKALELADLLARNKDPKAPLWTKQVAAFIYARQDRGCLAFNVIKNLIKDVNKNKLTIAKEDLEFMRHFVNIRLKKLKNNKFDPNKCKNAKLSR